MGAAIVMTALVKSSSSYRSTPKQQLLPFIIPYNFVVVVLQDDNWKAVINECFKKRKIKQFSFKFEVFRYRFQVPWSIFGICFGNLRGFPLSWKFRLFPSTKLKIIQIICTNYKSSKCTRVFRCVHLPIIVWQLQNYEKTCSFDLCCARELYNFNKLRTRVYCESKVFHFQDK